MKIPVQEKDKKKFFVVCPRVKESVDTSKECHKCYWCSIITCEYVMCRWTKKKEELMNGERYYETI